MGVSGQRHAPNALCPRERTPIPTGQEAGWTPEPVWTQRLEEKILRLSVQAVGRDIQKVYKFVRNLFRLVNPYI
jgi:hypothetical protein